MRASRREREVDIARYGYGSRSAQNLCKLLRYCVDGIITEVFVLPEVFEFVCFGKVIVVFFYMHECEFFGCLRSFNRYK